MAVGGSEGTVGGGLRSERDEKMAAVAAAPMAAEMLATIAKVVLDIVVRELNGGSMEEKEKKVPKRQMTTLQNRNASTRSHETLHCVRY